MKNIALMLGLSLALPALALSPNQPVENFELLDHTGTAHELYYLSDAKAVVFMVQDNQCAAIKQSLPEFKALRDAYQQQGVEFRMINSSLADNRTNIAAQADKLGIDIPILIDDTQIIGESLGLRRGGELFVVDPATWTVAYSGPASEGENQYLSDALASMVAGTAIEIAQAEIVGCDIDLPGNSMEQRKAHRQISYADTIAPMIRDNCVTCHRAGGMGPFAMTDYNIIRGFSPMIREVIRTKRMPPWHADPHYGEFSNDRSLSTQQIQDMVHWIESGSPRGDGQDILAQDNRVWPKFALGEPDFIIDIPATEVPATGVVDYQYKIVENPLDKDVWVAATEVIPGDNKALHHVIGMYGVENKNPNAKRKFMPMGGMGGYAPGTDPGLYPDGSGKFLPKTAKFSFQMHYTSYGKKTVDHTQIGVWLHQEKPKNVMQGRFIANTDIHIPPNTKRHTETKEFTFKREALLYSLLPHSHFRGIASDFIAKYPDGREEMLLSVPNYDFNWQTDYSFKEPKVMPAGTTILHTTTYDNSSQNPSNPDSTIDIYWGEQTFEEMLFASFSFRYLDNDSDRTTVAQSGGD